MAGLQAPQAQAAQPAPAFFAPRPAPVGPGSASVYSAPPSRREAGSREPQHPRQVKLTVLEQEMAPAIGPSDVAYAEGKLRLAREKQSGDGSHER